MYTILVAILPITLLISIGYYLNRIKFPNDDFWESADKFTYYVLFPSLLIYKLANADISNIDGYSFISSAIVAVLMISVILIILDKFALFFSEDAFTSVYQGSVRFNTYVFLALVSAIFGDEGLVLAALLISFLIPFLNIACITIFAIYIPNEKISFTSLFKSIATNPLIIACFIGGMINFFSISLAEPVNRTLELLSLAALPLGLLSVGVGLQFTFFKDVKMELFVALFFKLGLFVAFIFFTGKSFGVEGIALSILVLFASMPTASSAYILAKQLGGDTKLMSAIITLQTIVSIFTISFFMWILNI